MEHRRFSSYYTWHGVPLLLLEMKRDKGYPTNTGAKDKEKSRGRKELTQALVNLFKSFGVAQCNRLYEETTSTAA